MISQFNFELLKQQKPKDKQLYTGVINFLNILSELDPKDYPDKPYKGDLGLIWS